MKFSLPHLYELCHSTLVLCNTSANLQPSIPIFSYKLQTNFEFNFLLITLLFHFNEFCQSVLIPFITSDDLKPSISKLSYKLQMNSSFSFIFLINIDEILSLHLFELCHSTFILCNTSVDLKPSISKIYTNYKRTAILFLNFYFCKHWWNFLFHIWIGFIIQHKYYAVLVWTWNPQSPKFHTNCKLTLISIFDFFNIDEILSSAFMSFSIQDQYFEILVRTLSPKPPKSHINSEELQFQFIFLICMNCIDKKIASMWHCGDHYEGLGDVVYYKISWLFA